MKQLGRLILRICVGGFFFGHGTQKLFGWFGGHGLEGTAGFFEQVGMRPGRRNALAAGVAEAAGGAAIAAGAATPLASAALIATMLTAIKRVHLKNGPWAANGGYEYNVVLIAALLSLVDAGPGSLSLDARSWGERKGLAWTLATLGAGIAGAVGAHFAAEAAPPPPPAPQSQPAGADGQPAGAEGQPDAAAPAGAQPSSS
jgi:putative oxidoreductase